MKTKRLAHTINLRRIKANDIRAIAKLANSEYVEFQKQFDALKNNSKQGTPNTPPSIIFRLETIDDIEYSSDSVELFAEGEILDTKTVRKFHIDLEYKVLSAQIHVAIADSQYNKRPRLLEIQSTNELWVDGTFAKFMEIINSWEKQSSITTRFRGFLAIFVAAVGAIGIWRLIETILAKQSAKEQLSTSDINAVMFISMIVFFMTFTFFLSYIPKLWPEIEIVPTPEHERKLDKKRKSLWAIATLVGIPLVIDLFLR